MSLRSPHRATAEAVPPSMWPALALGLAPSLANFDVTAVVVALPAIARELQLDIAGYAWVMDAYSLAFTASLLVAGALADRYGRRAAMLWGSVIFAVASMACASAWNGMSLNLARAVQGVGAAFVVTGGIALIATAYPQAQSRTRAFSWLGVMSGIAMALGPTLGGIVSSWLGWRWIFLANVPVCVLVTWGIPHLVGEAKEASPRPVDFVGMLILTAALFVLIEALLYGRTARAMLLAGCALALMLFAVFALQQGRRAQPIFDPVVFLRPAMVGIAVLLAAVSIGYWTVLVYLPPFLGASLGVSADTGGIFMLAATLPMLFVPPLGGRIATALGWRWYFTLALAIMTIGGAGFVTVLTFDGTSSRWPVILAMIVVGLGAALAHPQLSGAVVALVPNEQAGMASAVTIVMRQAGFAVGIAAFGALLSSPDRALAYFWPFVGVTLACGLGVLAAVILLPPRPRGPSGADL